MSTVAFLMSSGLPHDDCLLVHCAGHIATNHTNHLEIQKASYIKEFIYKTETDSWTWKMSLWLPRGTSYRIREKKEQRIGVGIKESTLLMDSVMSEKC